MRQQIVPVAVGGFLHDLHGIQPGQVVGRAGRNDADQFGVDRQSRLLGRHEQVRLVVADQLVGRVGQHARKNGVVGVQHRLGKLDPQVALARLGGRVFVVALVGRKGDPGGGDLRDLGRRGGDRQADPRALWPGRCCDGMAGFETAFRSGNSTSIVSGKARLGIVGRRLHARVFGFDRVDKDQPGEVALRVLQRLEWGGMPHFQRADLGGIGLGGGIIVGETHVCG